jgi:hypothetical protein
MTLAAQKAASVPLRGLVANETQWLRKAEDRLEIANLATLVPLHRSTSELSRSQAQRPVRPM